MKIFYQIRSKVSLILCLSLFFVSTYSQNINELKQKKSEIEKEISSINTLINKTDKEEESSISNIKLAKRKIDLKNKYIKQIEEEENLIQSQINIRNLNIDSLKNLTESIKNEYKRIIIYSSKNKEKNNILLLIFSSKDFNQAYKRIKVYQQLLSYKSQQVEKYRLTIRSLNNETDKLNENVNQLSKKQKEKLSEITNLKSEQQNYQHKVIILGKKKKELYAELEKQKEVSIKINKEIKKLIEEEARRVREESKNKNNKLTSSYGASFKENIGKFTLPVENGIITGSYGESFHPVLKEVKVKNNGIDISISNKSSVYSIFKGEVRTIFKVPGSSLAMIIRHGNYLTVYSNLSMVNVSVGQEVNTYQKIGEIGIPKGENTNVLHFELWNENKTEDPLKWIKSN